MTKYTCGICRGGGDQPGDRFLHALAAAAPDARVPLEAAPAGMEVDAPSKPSQGLPTLAHTPPRAGRTAMVADSPTDILGATRALAAPDSLDPQQTSGAAAHGASVPAAATPNAGSLTPAAGPVSSAPAQETAPSGPSALESDTLPGSGGAARALAHRLLHEPAASLRAAIAAAIAAALMPRRGGSIEGRTTAWACV